MTSEDFAILYESFGAETYKEGIVCLSSNACVLYCDRRGASSFEKELKHYKSTGVIKFYVRTDLNSKSNKAKLTDFKVWL